MKRRGARNVLLIGPMGSGKSSVGRALARRLGWDFIDTDAEVERTAGRSVRAIFSGSGEASFRRLERKAVARAAKGASRVVAVGGGAVLSAANRSAMRRAGVVVYLQVSAETALKRAAAQGIAKRPLLSGGASPRTAMRRLLEARRPLYLGCSDLRARSIGRPDAVAERVARRLRMP